MDSRDPKGILNEELGDRLDPRSSLISTALIRAGTRKEAAWQGGPGPGCLAGAHVSNLGSTGSAFLLVMNSRYRDR